jgi:N-acetylneuraminic acid mutarotase
MRTVWSTLILAGTLAACLPATGAATGTGWQPGPTMPGPRFHAGVATGASGNIFVLGGQNYAVHPASTLMLNPRTGIWTTRHPMPVRLTDEGAVRLRRRIYAIGGFTTGPQGISDDVFVYSPRTNTWQYWIPLPGPLARMGAVTSGHMIYLIGGTDQTWEPTRNVLRYDPFRKVWETVAQMPDTRESFVTAKDTNGVIYVIGGAVLTSQGWKRTTSVEAYDPASGTWTTRAPAPISGTAATLGPDGRIYLTGDGTRSTAVYHPDSDAWFTSPRLNQARSEPGIAVSDGRIWTLGGYTGDYDSRVALASVESFRVP